MTATEEWTIAEVADHLGASSTGSARKTLSRWGVRAVRYAVGESGRPEARYNPDEIRAAKASRPGQGVRPDRIA